MKVYSALQEERIRDRTSVREWAASGMLDPAQSAALQAELGVELRQTHGFLRAVLFLFTSVIVIAGVALIDTAIRPHEHTEWTAIFLLSGFVCWALAEFGCAKHLYRYGLEEALAVFSAVFLSMGIAEMFARSSTSENIALLLVGFLGGLLLYFRFGFVYAAVASMALASAIPFQLEIGSEEQRLLAVAFFATVLALMLARRWQQPNEPAGSGRSTIEAASWLGIYLMLNLQLATAIFGVPYRLFFYSPNQSTIPEVHAWFYVTTWAMIWILPAAGLWLGLRRKERMLMDVSMLMALLSLSTNKRYLGWTVHSWDPILLGMLLITVAILIRRWLQRGTNGERSGFTAVRLLRSDERSLAALSIASAALQPHAAASGQAQPETGFREGGGKSGGGGATGDF